MFCSSDYFSRVQFVLSILVFYFIFCLDTYHRAMTIQFIFFSVIAKEKVFLGMFFIICCILHYFYTNIQNMGQDSKD